MSVYCVTYHYPGPIWPSLFFTGDYRVTGFRSLIELILSARNPELFFFEIVFFFFVKRRRRRK